MAKKEEVITKEDKVVYPKKARVVIVPEYQFGDKIYKKGETVSLTDKAYEHYKSKNILK